MPDMLRGLPRVAAAITLLMMIAGCGSTYTRDYGSFEWVPVTGRVTLDGKPLANALVQFIEPEKGVSTGVTDTDGNYSLRFDAKKDGATVGTKRVVVTTVFDPAQARYDGEEASAPEEKTAATPPPAEKVPAKYNTKSELTKDVVSGQPNVINLELKTAA